MKTPRPRIPATHESRERRLKELRWQADVVFELNSDLRDLLRKKVEIETQLRKERFKYKNMCAMFSGDAPMEDEDDDG